MAKPGTTDAERVAQGMGEREASVLLQQQILHPL